MNHPTHRASLIFLLSLSICSGSLDSYASPNELESAQQASVFLKSDIVTPGFIEETEHQVSEHLATHLEGLPEDDLKSRAIVEKMREEEEIHGANAKKAGAEKLPYLIQKTMRVAAQFMKSTAYHI